MFFQRFVKGICFDDDDAAQVILRQVGIQCNWWRKVGQITPDAVEQQLTERNLLWHLSRYADRDPDEHDEEFGKHTPFVSTTAGAVERDAAAGRNIPHPPFLTALRFATDDFTAIGYVFYGHLYTLGKQSIPLEAFAEEVRELHVYTAYLPYQLEGEITAKVHIPAHCISRCEKYDGVQAYAALASGCDPTAIAAFTNVAYAEPLSYANVRGFIE